MSSRSLPDFARARPRRAHRWLVGSLSAVAACAAVAAFATPAAARTFDTVRISSDPFTPANASTGQHQTEVEPDTFAFGDTVVSAFQVGRIPNGGASDVGFATSHNGGRSWTHGVLPAATVATTSPGPFFGASDASVAFDLRHHVWLISWLGLHASGGGVVDVMVSRSFDGVVWSAPVTVAATGTFYDKNWTACDNSLVSPFFGHCYTEFDNASQRDTELMSTSTNGGASWGAPESTADSVHGLGGQPVVQPDGRVIVPFEGVTQPGGIRAFTSDNGGKTWNASVLVSAIAFHPVAGDIRTSPLPSAEISGDGTVFVVWEDARFEQNGAANDIVLSSSHDGKNWSDVQRVPIGAVGSGADHFIPGLAVDRFSFGPRTALALTYYFYPTAACTAATCRLEVGFVSSRDAGRHWSDPRTLAGPMQLNWLANTTQGVMVGDYISTSFVGFGFEQRAVPAFAVGFAPAGGSAFTEPMFGADEPATGGPNKMGGDPVVFTGGGGTGGDDAATRPPTAF